MDIFRVHPKFLAICVLSTVIVLGDMRTAYAGCGLETAQCVLGDGLNGLAMGLVKPVQKKQLSYTVSSRGTALRADDVVSIEKPKIAQTRLMVREGADGEFGDIALGLSEGGSITVDLREDFLKIQYTLDF